MSHYDCDPTKPDDFYYRMPDTLKKFASVRLVQPVDRNNPQTEITWDDGSTAIIPARFNRPDLEAMEAIAAAIRAERRAKRP